MEQKMSEKVVLITGVGGGIGNTFLHYLIDKVKVLFTSSRSSEKEVLKFEKIPKNLTHYSMDLTEEKNVKKLFAHIEERYDHLDILINTIGGSLYSNLLENFPLTQFMQVFRVNLISAFLITKEAIELMKSQGGNIIHIVSSSAKRISSKKAPYGMAKSALATMIQYAAAETAKYNIKINGISPTYVFTQRHKREINQKIEKNEIERKELLKKITRSQLINKQLYPEDLIPTLELLMKTKVITGQIYNCSLGEVLSY